MSNAIAAIKNHVEQVDPVFRFLALFIFLCLLLLLGCCKFKLSEFLLP